MLEIRYFASLRESLGKAEERVEAGAGMTVTDVWQQLNPAVDMPGNLLCAINMNYVGLDAQVSDGDEVAFFPPVTGG